MMRRSVLALLASTLLAAPALAQQQDPLAPIDQAPVGQTSDSPPPAEAAPPAPPPVAVPRNWRGVFAAIRAGAWASAQAGIEVLSNGPLKPVARAEFYTAKDSPKVELGPILTLLAEAPELPEAEQLQRMAVARGAIAPPAIVYEQPSVFLGSSPRRQRAKAVSGEPLADTLRDQTVPLVEVDDAAGAEALFTAQALYLSSEARAEAAQRVAWIYYVLGRDEDARRIADQGRAGSVGEWGGQAAWISGLAAWRADECIPAGQAFRDTARLTQDRELATAALYWAARSAQACRRPREVEPLLLAAAARAPDSFYALVARETLGMNTRLPPLKRQPQHTDAAPNLVRARALSDIGERGLADEMIRHQARIGSASDHARLVDLSVELNLPGTQYWLAHNGPYGARVDPAARFPLLRWSPSAGWRIDPALAAAHTRQESDFRTGVVSPAGAVGLMQVRPGTAGDTARGRGVVLGDLKDPANNLEYGQSFIELMRAKPATKGQLLKVIAAYNAGPLPVDRWNTINDKGDPLLWVESLPYWETRYYVPSVLRNMFVYQGLEGRAQPALHALAEHKWPAWPTR